MQFTTILSAALLAVVASAGPIIPTTTVQFSNEASGRNFNAVIPFGVTQSVATLLAGSPLDSGHTFLATSFFLQSNFQGVQCYLQLPQYTATISEQHTYQGFAPVSNPLDLVNAQITCYKY
ncbi:uncharacterized protein L3040_007368 [Drepanopeziza brunnea f. sp. 'multigermtubi']|uniref:uncharacterized protein n=1 Tax=Drepanopeziza brunnea f. sp. 'multigermtubi' TaxID=698441 RepID=UPI00238D1E14|nr:hypothetical protein L3040_007368 [Drepanopeziza brunnea f. sp. 'multigermtubi']